MLAAELGCTLLEAKQLQIRAASEVLPYIEGKKPVDVNVRADGRVTFHIEGLADDVPEAMMIDAATGMPLLSLDGEETAEKRDFSPDDEGCSE